ncbi:uncharacterized protein [Choristoneura fumiferana]|uniref:uncharacterized protein n=1 Tax=Choristoneura fumiferana TaxID=7141 RepID=UPI003D154B7D
MEAVLQPPLPFKFENSLVNVTSGNLCKEWEKWKSAFLIYYEACEISKKDAKVQLNILLHIIGDKGRELYDQFKGESKNLNDALKKFDDFFLPKKNLTVERHKFFTRDQLEFESIEQYAFELSRMASMCGFKDLCDDLVRDRLICGIHEATLRERLLRETDLTLQKAIETCRLAEMSRVQAGHIKQENIEHHVHEISCPLENSAKQQCTSNCQCAQVRDGTKDQFVHAVSTSSASAVRRRRSPWRGGRRGPAVPAPGRLRAGPAPARNDAQHHDTQATSGRWQRQSPRPWPAHRCWRCGSSHRRFQCPAFGQQCGRCSGKNHYSKMCRVYEMKGESTDEEWDAYLENTGYNYKNTPFQAGGIKYTEPRKIYIPDLPLSVPESSAADTDNSMYGYACGTCAAIFRSEKEFDVHKVTHQMDEEKPIIDTEQSKLNKNSILVLADPYHKGKTYCCMQCNAKFQRLNNCQRHVKSHILPTEAGIKQAFKCKICHSLFHHAPTLLKHIMKSHIKIEK